MVVNQHGLHKWITSDHDPQFCASFWDKLMSLLDTTFNFSIAVHPQTNGIAKVENFTIEQLLHIYA